MTTNISLRTQLLPQSWRRGFREREMSFYDHTCSFPASGGILLCKCVVMYCAFHVHFLQGEIRRFGEGWLGMTWSLPPLPPVLRSTTEGGLQRQKVSCSWGPLWTSPPQPAWNPWWDAYKAANRRSYNIPLKKTNRNVRSYKKYVSGSYAANLWQCLPRSRYM